MRTGSRNDLDLFHALHQASARRKGFASMSERYIRQHWDALAPRGLTRLVLAYYENAALAGLWLTAFGTTVTERLSGWAADEHRTVYPAAVCRWETIRWAKECGFRYYDFGGIDRRYAELMVAGLALPADFHSTTAAFKWRFGPDPVLLPTGSQFMLNPLARPIIRYLHPKLARSKVLHRLTRRLRNG